MAHELKCWGRIYAAVRALRWMPDIVHAQDPGSASAARLGLGCPVPMVVTCHFNEDLTDEALNQAGIRPQAARVLRLWHAWTFRQTWPWIAVSRYAADGLRRHLPGGAPIQVIHNGVNFEAFAAISPDPLLARSPQGLVRILNAGTLEPRKNQGFILDVAERLRDLPVLFLLAGDGPDRTKLARAIGQRGLNDRVQLLGYRRDLHAVMRACDIYLHVADRENCPFVVIEAIAAGLPVMSLASGGIPELVETTADEALITGASPVPAMAERLAAWIRRPEVRSTLARRQHDYAISRFSLSQVLIRTEACYQDLAGGLLDRDFSHRK
jgi:glycosyltransferase involved in cell wall biosynthesis